MNKHITCFLVLVLCINTYCQIDTAFIAHLSNNNLKGEYSTYLDKIKGPSDSISYQKAKYFFTYGYDSLFINEWSNCNYLLLNDTILLKQASLHFLKIDNENSRKWFNNILLKNYFWKELYILSKNPNKHSQAIMCEEVQRAYNSYKKLYNKSPWVAAGISIILPGLGKLYAGKKNTFFLSFLLPAAYGLQSYESYKKLGLKHPFTIVNLSAFTVFYVTNIYGSYYSLIEKRKEKKKKFLTDVARYYY